MKHLFFTLALLLVHCVQAQNPAKILAPKFIIGSTSYPLPQVAGSTSPTTGYFGQAAQASQNIIVDNQNKIKCISYTLPVLKPNKRNRCN